jgi:MFS family permease
VWGVAARSPESRNVTVLAASIFGLALGEELWQAYLPAYLTALGAGGVAVGLFGSLKDLLDGLYQYPGGWLADRFGRRRALLVFTVAAVIGYLIYAAAPSWPIVFVGLLGVMGWKAGAFPTTFAVIGDSLPRGKRATAFGVQSVLVRVPRVVGAPLGGLLIAAAGLVGGLRRAFLMTFVIGLAVLWVQYRWFADDRPTDDRPTSRSGLRLSASVPPSDVRPSASNLPAALRPLLVADCLVRIGEGIAASFIVLFVTDVRGVPLAQYGVLYALQQGIAILSYLPGGRLADLQGRMPVIVLTFFFFAAFPLAVWLATNPAALWLAFVVGGLKEIGEPARKSLIVDLAPDERRARVVGLYYTIRNLAVVPAGLAGGLLWQRAPHLPLIAAGVVGMAGLAVFAVTSRSKTVR